MFSLKKALSAVALASPLALVGVPDAGALDLTGASKPRQETLEVLMACGKADKGNCAKVVPAIAAKMPAGVTLQGANTEGSVESAKLVCKGSVDVNGKSIPVPTALVQADAAAAIAASEPGCANALMMVGQPVYPYVLFAVVRADSPYNDFNDMVSDYRKQGKKLSVSAGKEGSGGLATLRNLMKADDTLKNTVDVSAYDQAVALQQVGDGQLAVFFSMDAPDSDFIDKIKAAVDANGKPKFKFIDVDPDDFQNVLKLKAFNRPLYEETNFSVPGGWFGRTIDTMATFAAVVANRTWANGDGAKAVVSIGGALNDANAALREATKTPNGWVPPALVK